MNKKITVGICILVIITGVILLSVYAINLNKKDEVKTYSFNGTVMSTYGISENQEKATKTIIVVPDETEEIKRSSDQIAVNLDNTYNEQVNPGDKVKVTYTGEVMESYPAKVNCTDIEIIK